MSVSALDAFPSVRESSCLQTVNFLYSLSTGFPRSWSLFLHSFSLFFFFHVFSPSGTIAQIKITNDRYDAACVWYSRFDLSRPVEGFKETGTTTLSTEEDRAQLSALIFISIQSRKTVCSGRYEERVDVKES